VRSAALASALDSPATRAPKRVVLVVDPPAGEHVGVGQELALRVALEQEHLRAGRRVAQQHDGRGGYGFHGHRVILYDREAVSAGKGSTPRVLELHSARAVDERIAALARELAPRWRGARRSWS